ncbi:integrase, catalytic region, zinc finger, CCHC-type containing protein [Tanacetum coccineum]
MSTQQDIYAAGSESHPLMLNKENYVPWSRMIPEPGDAARTVSVPEMFHEQTDDELTEAEIKQMEADDQAIQTILLGLPEDIYAAVDSCETAQEICRHVTIVHQTKDLHTADYTQLYDFLKYNQKEVDELRAERLAETQDPLALMANSNNPFNYPVFHPDLPSSTNHNGNGNVVAARAEGNANGDNADLDEIEDVNANCILMANFDLQWGNILITRVYFVEGLGHNLFSIGLFCDLDLEVAFRRNTCFVRNLEGVDLLKGNHTTNLYTINLHDMASASPICLMACATSTKSWLWHQRLSHLNFNTINDLARNDLVTGLPKFKYHKEHLCPSCEQGKSKRASHSPKPVPNSKQRLHLLHMDLCGPMRIASINGKRYVLVIVDDYSRYTWVVFLRSKDEAPDEIKTFFKKITILLQAPVIINDHEDIRKLGAKGDIGFFIGYSANSCAYIVYNRRTKKIMETMNVTFDELSAMAFEQSSLKPELQSMTSGQISSGLDLPYASSTITTQKPTEGELDLLFEAMYNDHIGGQPSAAPRTILAAQAPQVLIRTP